MFFLSPNLVRKSEEKKPKTFTKNVLWNKQVKNVTVSLGLFRMINKKEYCGRKFLIFVEMLKLTSYTCIHIFVSW